MIRLTAIALAGTVLMLSGCGGGGGGGFALNVPSVVDSGRGSVVTVPPQQMAQLSVADFSSLLNANAQGKQLLQVTGAPKCGIVLRYLEYRTIGGQGEATNATAAIMVPDGATLPAPARARRAVCARHQQREKLQPRAMDRCHPARSR